MDGQDFYLQYKDSTIGNLTFIDLLQEQIL